VSRRSTAETDSGSPYENREYIESKTREMLKRNSRNQAAISSQDLRESFVEPLDWHDDFDDNVKVRFGRGLKAVDDIAVQDIANKTLARVNVSDTANAVNSYSRDSTGTHSSVSRDCYANATASLMHIFNVRRGTINSDEDLEAVEQKYVKRKTPRMKRAAASYRTFYDDVNQNQREESDDADKKLAGRSQLPNIFENQPGGMYKRAPNWSDDTRVLNRYSRVPQNPKKKEKNKRSKRNKKKKKHMAEKRHKNGPRPSSSKHQAHRSDVSKIESRGERSSKKKNKARAFALTGRGSIQKGKTGAERGLFRAAVNEDPVERVLYENAEDRSVSERAIGDRVVGHGLKREKD